ncbi:MAG: histidinol phosphate phosphatase [Clostridia bacterium]|nr:histidinol phosphate phosphatase [Clostridia bacterium]
MKTRQNLHMHSLWDDGKNSCREMLMACRESGLTSAGVSLHSPMPFPNDWTIGADRVSEYLAEMDGLRNAWPDFRVLCGIEWDVLSTEVDLCAFDYVIGSVHHLPVREVPPSVDNTPEGLAEAVRDCFGGDADAAAECYFGELLQVAAQPRARICGHFDLLLKFNERLHLFNPESPRYRRAALRALEALLSAGKVIEVNTGAMARGWRSVPYPEAFWLREIRRQQGRVMLSSDAHSCAHVTFEFEETEALLRSCGFDSVVELDPSGEFTEVPLS